MQQISQPEDSSQDHIPIPKSLKSPFQTELPLEKIKTNQTKDKTTRDLEGSSSSKLASLLSTQQDLVRFQERHGTVEQRRKLVNQITAEDLKLKEYCSVAFLAVSQAFD